MSRHLLRLVWVAVLALTATALSSHAEPKKTTKPEPEAVLTIRFTNGSVVNNAVLLDPVEMDSKLGKITIAPDDVSRIDFGFRLSEEDTKKLEQALKDLGSDKFANRETATKTIAGMGKLAYPSLMERRKAGDVELQRRVELLLKDIKARYPAESLFTRRTDILRAGDSVVGGQITSPTLRIKCEVFGEVKVPLWRLKELRSTKPGSEVVVAVDSSKYGNRMSWKETEFEVTLGTKVLIAASGEINLDPTNQLGGNLNTRNVMPQGTVGLVSGEMFVPGQLIGRIGTDGPQFVIGKGTTLTPSREGKLYLRIITIFHANNVNAEGNYQVRISAEPGGP